MIYFKLIPSNLIYLNIRYDIIEINNNNQIEHERHIENTISNFNEEIKWDNMFNTKEVQYRFENGMIMFIGINEGKPFGHVWFRKHDDGFLLFNLFVINKTQNKNWSGKEFVFDILHRFFNKEIIYSEVDEWNVKSIKLFEKLGFVRC